MIFEYEQESESSTHTYCTIYHLSWNSYIHFRKTSSYPNSNSVECDMLQFQVCTMHGLKSNFDLLGGAKMLTSDSSECITNVSPSSTESMETLRNSDLWSNRFNCILKFNNNAANVQKTSIHIIYKPRTFSLLLILLSLTMLTKRNTKTKQQQNLKIIWDGMNPIRRHVVTSLYFTKTLDIWTSALLH